MHESVLLCAVKTVILPLDSAKKATHLLFLPLLSQSSVYISKFRIDYY